MARVLVVEPDRRIRSFIAGILADFGHQVERCGDPARAGQRLCRARFDVVATDLALEDCVLAPQLRVLTLSGQPRRPDAARSEPPLRLRDKPFRFADLASLVAAIGARERGYSLVA
jgi:hypothetical protein